MAEQMDWHVRTGSTEPSWLAGLIDRIEMVSQSEQRAARCEPAMIAACQRYLARPSAVVGCRAVEAAALGQLPRRSARLMPSRNSIAVRSRECAISMLPIAEQSAKR